MVFVFFAESTLSTNAVCPVFDSAQAAPRARLRQSVRSLDHHGRLSQACRLVKRKVQKRGGGRTNCLSDRIQSAAQKPLTRPAAAELLYPPSGNHFPFSAADTESISKRPAIGGEDFAARYLLVVKTLTKRSQAESEPSVLQRESDGIRFDKRMVRRPGG